MPRPLHAGDMAAPKSCWSCLDWACRIMARELFTVGDRVQVNQKFRSVRIVLLRGWCGTVISVNRRGDIKIEFDDCGECEWVHGWNTNKLTRAPSSSFLGTWCYGKFGRFTLSDERGSRQKLFFNDSERTGVLMAAGSFVQGTLTKHNGNARPCGQVRLCKVSKDELHVEFMDNKDLAWKSAGPVLRKSMRDTVLKQIGFLPEPDITKVVEDSSEGAPCVYGCCSIQGWRQSMEDAHVCTSSFGNEAGVSFFAVFDGHCGAQVARFCGRHVVEEILSTKAYKEKHYAEAMRQSFLGLDERMLADWPSSVISPGGKYPADPSSEVKPVEPYAYAPRNPGCTALACFIEEHRLHLANAGDSRAVLCRDGVAVELTVDHGTSVETERTRIEKAGGYIANGRVNGMLQPTRSLGDFFFKNRQSLTAEEQQVTANAETFSFNIGPGDEFVVLACDGVWDKWTSQQVVDFIRKRMTEACDAMKAPLSGIAGKLLDELVSPEVFSEDGGGCDNMSCIIVSLHKRWQMLPTHVSCSRPA